MKDLFFKKRIGPEENDTEPEIVINPAEEETDPHEKLSTLQFKEMICRCRNLFRVSAERSINQN